MLKDTLHPPTRMIEYTWVWMLLDGVKIVRLSLDAIRKVIMRISAEPPKKPPPCKTTTHARARPHPHTKNGQIRVWACGRVGVREASAGQLHMVLVGLLKAIGTELGISGKPKRPNAKKNASHRTRTYTSSTRGYGCGLGVGVVWGWGWLGHGVSHSSTRVEVFEQTIVTRNSKPLFSIQK